jgi:hypothetical protein
MNADEFFPSKFLKASDIPGPKVVTIESVSPEWLGQGSEADRKLIVRFKEIDRGLVLNKTNYRSLLELTATSDTDNWIGKRIQLVSVRVDFQGRRVPSIRIEPAPTKPTTPAADQNDAVGI